MIINEIKNGGMEVWLNSGDLMCLALLLDDAAHVMRETPDKELMRDGAVEQVEVLCALFSAGAVACSAQDHLPPSDEVWLNRENTKPALHKPA